jgi:hypothetical protein
MHACSRLRNTTTTYTLYLCTYTLSIANIATTCMRACMHACMHEAYLIFLPLYILSLALGTLQRLHAWKQMHCPFTLVVI